MINSLFKLLILIILSLTFNHSNVFGIETTRNGVEAILIVKFLKFIEWPVYDSIKTNTDSLKICILGNEEIYESLN